MEEEEGGGGGGGKKEEEEEEGVSVETSDTMISFCFLVCFSLILRELVASEKAAEAEEEEEEEEGGGGILDNVKHSVLRRGLPCS
mmetsp:Transcript_14385/g.14493  ORF Transcript_14385/g.14493 Transcript_14385/m.14493 type:complete len:85 (+) Transcript_14385:542-796(+)